MDGEGKLTMRASILLAAMLLCAILVPTTPSVDAVSGPSSQGTEECSSGGGSKYCKYVVDKPSDYSKYKYDNGNYCEVEDFSDDYAGVYMGKNDGLYELEHSLMSLEARGITTKPDMMISVVGSLSALDLLTELSPKYLILFDANDKANLFAKMVMELILKSDNPQDFLANVFCRDVRHFELTHGKITPSNQEEFLDLPVDEDLSDAVMSLLSLEGTITYKNTFEKVTQTEPWSDSEATTQHLMPCDPLDHDTLNEYGYECAPSGLGYHQRRARTSSLRYGEGFLENEYKYNQVKQALRAVEEIEYRTLEVSDSIPDLARACSIRRSQTTVLFTSDLYAYGCYGLRMYQEELDMLKTKCGKDKFVWIQSMSKHKAEIVTNVRDDGYVESWSDWDSRGLHHKDLEERTNTLCGLEPVPLEQFQNEWSHVRKEAENLASVVRTELETIWSNRANEGNIAAFEKERESGIPKFPYLHTQCMRTRHEWAMRRMTSCRRVLDIGGYLTPLATVGSFSKVPHNVSLVVNVDLSAREVQVAQIPSFTEDEVYGLNLPITLGEFGELINRGILEEGFDCIFGLGIGQALKEDGEAFVSFLDKADTVVLESPRCVILSNEGITHAEPMMEAANFILMEEENIDCRTDDATISLYDSDSWSDICLIRDMVLYSRNSQKGSLKEQ